MKQTSSAKKVTLCALFAALALIFSYIEAILPLSIGIPGVKLGLANLVVIIALYTFGFKYAFSINIIRILMAGLLFSGLFGALYSLAGGILSLLMMYLLYRTKVFSIIGVSVGGAVTHNFGQLIIASIMVSNIKMFVYFPVLIFSGVISGILIGIAAYALLKKMPASVFKLS